MSVDLKQMSREELEALVLKLASQAVKTTSVKVPKNKAVGVPKRGRFYTLLSKDLENWGKIPEQQRDLASILKANMTVGEKYSETDVFNFVINGTGDYPSLYRSVQDPTYLFKYYRNLGRTATHGGFVARNFLRVSDEVVSE